MIKKILALFVSTLMLLSTVIMNVDASGLEAMVGPNVKSSLDMLNDSLVISGTGDMYDFDGLEDTGYNGWMFMLETLTVKNGVTSIGNNAFSGYTQLKNVNLADSIRRIGNSAFAGCIRLKELRMPTNLTTLGKNAFALTTIEKVYIDDLEKWCNVESELGSSPITSATKIYINDKLVTELVVPDSVTTIKEGLFEFADTLKTVQIPESVTKIEDFSLPSSCKFIVYEGSYAYQYMKKKGYNYEIKTKDSQNVEMSTITSKTYGDKHFALQLTDKNPELGVFTYTSSNTDIATVDKNGNVTIKNAGETNITVKRGGNSTYAPFSETQKLVVKKVPITITAKNTSKKIGTADPKLEFDYAGTFVGDDGFSGELTRQPGEEVGKYDILIGTLAINDNYEITYNKGMFEIFDKTPQNISVVDFGEKTYGDEAFKISATADENANLSNFSYESDNKDVAEVTADGTITVKAAGEANIKVKEPGNDDYAAFEKTIKLVVKKKGVEIKSINIDDKTAALDGVLTEDTDKVTVDFEKVTVEITGEADETSSNVILKNFALKGKKAANYEIITNAFESVIANDKIVNVSVKGENCVLTGGAKYLKGTSVTVTAAPESRYRFRGWYIGDTQVSDKAEYTFTAEEDIELTAKCTRKRSSSSSGSTGGSISGGSSSYTINFATNGGSEMKSIGVKANQAIGEIAEPTKEGYVFTGWYSDKELTKPFGKEDRITASVTLYAGWKIDPVRQLILTIGEKSAKAFGKDVENDVAPIIRNDRTMLPARFVAENLGAKVLWYEDKQLVTVSGKNEKDEDVTILITIGADAAIVNGEEIKLDSPAFIENDRTYTPVRFIAEQLGTSVEWNEEAKTVTITK